MCDLSVQVTGTRPLDALLEALEPLGATDTVATLGKARGALASLDNGSGSFDPTRYREAASMLEALGAPGKIEQALAVDLTIQLDGATLGSEVTGEIAGRIEALLGRLAPARDSDLDAFKHAFRERYDEREVPLLEVLDSERGIGFGSELPDPSPLLDGIVGARAPAKAPFGSREAHLLGLLEHAWSSGSREIALSHADVEALADDVAPPLSAALAAVVTLARAPRPARESCSRAPTDRPGSSCSAASATPTRGSRPPCAGTCGPRRRSSPTRCSRR